MAKTMRFALAGNPNSGKTTLFNSLTGSKAHVGNWPGVTVEKKEGYYRRLSEPVVITDLPGIYSLSPYTPEEVVTRRYILEEKPDAIINIVDATNLERNLYLTTQILEIDIPVVIALNMIDAVEKNGDKIDVPALEAALGVPVVEVSALKGTGIHELMKKVYEAGKGRRKGTSVLDSSKYSELFRFAVSRFEEEKVEHPVFHAVKMLENDAMEITGHENVHAEVEAKKLGYPEDIFRRDYEAIVADARYQRICSDFSPAFKRRLPVGTLTRSDKIDRVMTHRIWGIPLFLVIMLAVFHLTFSDNFLLLGGLIPEGSFDNPIFGTDSINSPGVILANCMSWITDTLMNLVKGAMPADVWYTGLICDGLLSGLFAVLSFIPQISVLFLFLSVLEDSGYMSRVAFIMDKAFRKFGLSGRAFLPLLMCFGCAVPGIMATRTLENDRERALTIKLSPFFSCGAKLPIWATFAALLYGGTKGDLVVFGMYLIGIVVAILAAIILKLFAKKTETPPFIMELPNYHLPQFKNTVIHLWEKIKSYIIRAATVIAGSVIVIWFLSSFSFTFRYVTDPGMSILGQISKVISVLFVPVGFGGGENGWKFVVSLCTGLIAKEMVVASLGTFAGMSDLGGAAGGLIGTPIALLIGSMSTPAAWSFMAFNLLTIPCMAAVAAARAELKSRKKLWGTIGFWFATAYVVSALIYWIGTYWWIGLIVLAAVAIAVAILILLRRNKDNPPRALGEGGVK